jgi:phage terminase large subunit-like protein
MTNPVDEYARAVVAGKVPAGKYHRLACARHLKDRARESTPGFPYRFDWKPADSFLRFSRLMRHYKGRQFANQMFAPSEFQVFRLGSIFGWRHVETGLRRFTTAYNELPRKSGKSFEAALVALYVTFYEGEPGAEGYCLATKEKQARIVFDACKRMAKTSGIRRVNVQAKNLNNAQMEQKLEPLGSDSETTDGLNPHLVIVDELHAFKTRGLLDVVESATGARLNPLHFQITTAGADIVSVCGDQHTYACQILDGVLEDDPSTLSFFACIAHADKDDDWKNETTWIKANPHWNVSVNPEDIRKLAAKAIQIPAAAQEFKQKRLNIWGDGSSDPCLSVDGWRAGQRLQAREEWIEALLHETCFVGIDLASKIDLCSLVFVFPPTVGESRWRWLVKSWTPEDTLENRAHRDRAPYGVWRDQGGLQTTPGTRIDHRVIREAIAWGRERFDIEQIGFDPWHAGTLINELVTDDGFTEEQVLEVPQTYAGMSSACLAVQADTLAGGIDANGCPVTAWCISNTVGQKDNKGNLMFAKGKSRGRIDPVIAATIGSSLALRMPAEAESVYEKRGPIMLA